MIRSVLRVVDLALETTRRQLMQSRHQVDHGSVFSIIPSLDPTRQEALVIDRKAPAPGLAADVWGMCGAYSRDSEQSLRVIL